MPPHGFNWWEGFDPLWTFDGGIYKPASEVPKPEPWGMTGGGWTNANSLPTADEIMATIKKFQKDFPKPVDVTPGFLSSSLGVPGIASAKYDFPPLEAWAERGYDASSLPQNPRVSLHKHPREITPERVREITGGAMTE
jgi:hypothetical protein